MKKRGLLVSTVKISASFRVDLLFVQSILFLILTVQATNTKESTLPSSTKIQEFTAYYIPVQLAHRVTTNTS